MFAGLCFIWNICRQVFIFMCTIVLATGKQKAGRKEARCLVLSWNLLTNKVSKAKMKQHTPKLIETILSSIPVLWDPIKLFKHKKSSHQRPKLIYSKKAICLYFVLWCKKFRSPSIEFVASSALTTILLSVSASLVIYILHIK